MMRFLLILLCAFLLPASAVGEEGQQGKPDDNAGLTVISCAPEDAIPLDSLDAVRAEAWQEYADARLNDADLAAEMAHRAMAFGEATMRYTVETVGQKPENGYPLYIALHGGGSSDTPDINNQQWEAMQVYYRRALTCGVYVAVRGVRDTWDTHFNPESYPLYDRLIQNLILTQDVDPNRVYLEGFSAGGDGVYAVSPRMADRFAAVNMSAGHPNGVHFLNMKNLPIQLQVGENDTAYNRNTVTAEYDALLNEYAARYGGFTHRTLIHYNAGHNYADYDTKKLLSMADPQAWLSSGDRSFVSVNSFPPDYMNQFTRDPLPKDVIWELDTRAELRDVESFYYLRAPKTTNQGVIRAQYSREANRIDIQTQGLNGDFSVLLNEEMADFEKPIEIILNGEARLVRATPSRAVLRNTTAERGDLNYQFEAEIPVSQVFDIR